MSDFRVLWALLLKKLCIGSDIITLYNESIHVNYVCVFIRLIRQNKLLLMTINMSLKTMLKNKDGLGVVLDCIDS